MKNYKHKGRLAFLWLLLAIGFFVCSPFRAQADDFGLTTVKNPIGQEKFNSDDCALSTVRSSYGDPWWKPPLTTLMGASASVGQGMFTTASDGMKRLVVVGAGLWLVTFMMKVLGGMVETDPMENLTKVGGMMLRVGFAWIFLDYAFFDRFIFDTILDLVTGLSGSGGGGPGALIGLADRIHDSIVDIRAKAWVLVCVSPHMATFFGVDIPFPDLGDIGGGLAIGCVAVLFNIAFPFFLFDAVFRMGVVIGVSPLFIGAWVFDVTRPYAKKGANAVMNVGFVFLMVFVAAEIAIKLIQQVSGLTGDPEHDICLYRMFGDLSKDGSASCDGVTGGGMTALFLLGICCAYGLLIMHEGSNKLANYFSETDFSNDTAFQAAKGGTVGMANMANNAINFGADAAKAGGQLAKGTMQAAGIAGGAASWAAGKAARPFVAMGRGLKSLGNRLRGGSGSSGGGRGSNNNFNDNGRGGSRTRLNANASANTPQRPAGVPQSASYNSKNQTWTASSTDKNGNTSTTVMDKDGNRRSLTKRDSNGNITSQTQFRNGNPVSTMTASYDSQGRKTGETISDGGNTTTRNFDENGRLSSQTERKADGTTTKSEWKRDANGKVTGSSVETKRKDGSKETTVFEHDANGKRKAGLRTTTDVSGKERTDFVDKNGNSLESSYTDGSGARHVYTRDDNGNVTHSDHFDQSGNKTGSTDLSYDNRGNITGVVNRDANGKKTGERVMDYDASGNYKGMAETNVDKSGKETTRVYDADGRIIG